MGIFFVNKLLKIFLFLILFIYYKHFQSHREVNKEIWVVLTSKAYKLDIIS